jgi:hypothetical protein
MESGEERIEAADFEAIPEEVEAVAEHQEVPDEEVASVKNVGAQKDRSGDQRPAVEYRNLRKRRNKDDVVRRAPKGRTFERRRRAQTKCDNGSK